MRRLFRGLLVFVGFLLVVVLGAAAVVFGPDDSVMLGSAEVPGGNVDVHGPPIVSAPAITAFRGVDLIVEAEASGGVFIGSGHQVDVLDLVADTTHYEVYAVRPGQVDVGLREDRADWSLDREWDLWQDTSSGDGLRTLTVPLTGEAVTVLVAAIEPAEPVTLSVGAHLGGFFLVCLAGALLGLAMLVTAWLLGRRGRRTQRAETPGQAEPVDGTVDSAPQPGSGPGSVRVGRFALPLAAGLFLSGCTLPATVALETATKQAVVEAEVSELVDGYAARHQMARKRANKPKYSLTGWSAAQTGPLLEASRHATARDRLRKQAKRQQGPVTFGERIYSGDFASYPMWALVETAGLVTTGELLLRKETKKSTAQGLTLMVRERAAEPWKANASVRVRADDLPDATDTPEIDPAGATESAAVATKALRAWWASGKGKPKKLTLDLHTPKTRANAVKGLKHPDIATNITVTTLDWPTKDERSRVIEVDDGHLATVTFMVRVTTTPAPGVARLVWKPGFSALYGTTHTGLHISFVATAMIHLPREGTPIVLGSSTAEMYG